MPEINKAMKTLYTLFALILLSSPLPAQTAKDPHVKVSLVSDMQVVQPGQKFRVALKFEPDKDWHTYWRNPGDAGLAPTFELGVPKGFTAGDIDWPFPSVMGEAPDLSYGYNGVVLLPVTVTAASDAAGDSVTFTAKTEWMVCHEHCVPGKADLTLTIALGDKSLESAETALFDETSRNLARVAGKITMTARRDSGMYELRIANAPERPGKLPASLRFFPYDDGVIDHSADQSIEYSERVVVMRFPASPYETERPTKLRGVLVSQGSAWNGDHLRAIVVDVVVENAPAPGH